MSAIPPQADNPNGLHQRYVISHADGSPIDPLATYFVLRLDSHGRDPLAEMDVDSDIINAVLWIVSDHWPDALVNTTTAPPAGEGKA